MLHTGLKDIGGAAPTPFQTKAEEMKWLKGRLVGRLRQVPTSACKAGGSPATGTSHNPEALQDPPLSCHQTTGGQHDGGEHLPARHIESDKGPQHGLGVPGGPDGSICAADHRTSAPTGRTQAVAGCHACPTSTAEYA